MTTTLFELPLLCRYCKYITTSSRLCTSDLLDRLRMYSCSGKPHFLYIEACLNADRASGLVDRTYQDGVT